MVWELDTLIEATVVHANLLPIYVEFVVRENTVTLMEVYCSASLPAIVLGSFLVHGEELLI